MINKIRNSGTETISTTAKNKNTAVSSDAQAKQTAPGQTNVTDDSVKLTGTADKLRSISNQLAQDNPVDQNKVDRLRKAIDSGEYQVDAKKLAQKFVQFEDQFEK